MAPLQQLPPEILDGIYHLLDREGKGNWCLVCKSLWRVRGLRHLQISGGSGRDKYLHFLVNQRHGRQHLERLEIRLERSVIPKFDVILASLTGLVRVRLYSATAAMVASLTPLARLSGLVSLSLVDCDSFGTKGHRVLGLLTQLVSLEIRPVEELERRAWGWLSSLGRLRELEINANVRLKPSDVEGLASLGVLQSLVLDGPGLWYTSSLPTANISRLTSLTSLSLRKYSTYNCQSLQLSSMPLLRKLEIVESWSARWSGVEPTLRDLTSLESLTISKSTIRAYHLNQIGEMTGLTTLDLSDTVLGSCLVELDRELRRLSLLRELRIDGCGVLLTSSTLRLVHQLPRLELLVINAQDVGWYVTDLCDATHLRRLLLRGTPEEVGGVRRVMGRLGSGIKVERLAG